MIYFSRHKAIIFCLLLAAVFAVSCGKGDEYAQECYRQGREKREAGEPVAAMQCFINATHSRTRDFHILGCIYSNMGSICSKIINL